METAESILYETLSPLASAESNNSYVVLRNEIPLSAIQSSLDGTPAPDYFSLDVVGEDDKATSIPSALSPAATPVKEPVRTLEGNWFRGNSRFKSPMLQLHKEILDFCEFLSPTPEEDASRKEAIESVVKVIKHIWPNCQVEVFGSFRTGLYLPTSDIDIVILGSDIQNPQIGLHALSRLLSQNRVGKKIQVIAKARVPIVKFNEKKSGIAFDISFDMENGPKAAEFIQDAVSKWAPLRPLCLILKIFLQQRELNEVYTGGIGSYALLVMLIAMLQNYQNSRASPEHNLGVLLVNFFDIYGRKLNTADVGVSCNGGGTFFLKSMKGFSVPGKQYMISIEDPQAPENDIGRSSFNYFQVRSAFAMAFATLTNLKAISGLGPNRSILGTIIRPDAALLERKGGSNGDNTTFKELLSGSGDPIPIMGEYQELYCNWHLDDENDEPLPRSNAIFMDSDSESLAKKRKKSMEMKAGKKTRENGNGNSIRHENGGSKSEKSNQYHGRSHRRNGGNRNGYDDHHGRVSSSVGCNGNRYNRHGRVSSPWAQGRQN